MNIFFFLKMESESGHKNFVANGKMLVVVVSLAWSELPIGAIWKWDTPFSNGEINGQLSSRNRHARALQAKMADQRPAEGFL